MPKKDVERTKMEEKIWLSSPTMCGKEIDYINEAFETNWIAPLGPHVNAFEVEVAEVVGKKHGAALSSGTAAIHLALKALDVKEDDIVFCSSLTFSASANPILYENAIPVFIDSEPDTWNMSPKALEKAFKKYQPKAVIIVNLYGQSAEMEKLVEICKQNKTPIIEDAAESLGATYRGRPSGSFGDFSILSFNGNKIITTSGGGMLLSSDKEAIEKARFWATQSRDKARHYQHSEIGYNYRMSNICAGIGRGQLTILKERIKQKKKIYETYEEAFKDIKAIEMMPISEKGESNYWLSCITLKEGSKVKPLEIIKTLEKENIESRPIWKPMHKQPIFKDNDFFSHYDKKEENISEDIYNRGLCLPSDVKMTEKEITAVITLIKNLFS